MSNVRTQSSGATAARKGAPASGARKPAPAPTVQVTTRAEQLRYKEVLDSLVRTSDSDIDTYSGLSDPDVNRVVDRISKVSVGIQSSDMIFNSDMTADVTTTGMSLVEVWSRVKGVTTAVESNVEKYYEESSVTHEVKSCQIKIESQGARDIKLHYSIPFKLDGLPDNYNNGATSVRTVANSANTELPANGRLLSTTSKPGGPSKQYATQLFENVNATGAVKPHDLYFKLLEFVVSCDENAKFGATTKQSQTAGLVVSVMTREAINPRGRRSTAPDILIAKKTFIPNAWPTIIAPTVSGISSGEIPLTQFNEQGQLMPDVIGSRDSRSGERSVVQDFGGKLGRNLRLQDSYVYTTSGASFGIRADDRGGVLCPRYAFTRRGFVFYALTERDAMNGKAVSVPGAVIPHGTTFRPLFPVNGAFGARSGEYAGGALPLMTLVRLVSKG